MKSVFVLWYRWTDNPSESVSEHFNTLDKAEAERDRLQADELARKVFDPASIGKLELKIERYNFDVVCSTIFV